MAAWGWVLIAIIGTFTVSYTLTRIVQIRALRRELGLDEDRVLDLTQISPFDTPSRIVTVEDLETLERKGRAS